jgi:DNA adenine methylase
MNLDINNYPGSKNGSGVKQWIINHIPEYEIFIEGFGGSAVLTSTLKEKIESKRYIVFEKYPPVFEQLKNKLLKDYRVLLNTDFIETTENILIEIWKSKENTIINRFHNFYYLDPPYLKESRKSAANIYGCEWSIDDHIRFLVLVNDLSNLGCRIMISHYDCELYREYLKDWHTSTFQTMTRGGVAEEKIWMNYDITKLNLACTDFVGKNFTDRQAILRKMNRYRKKLDSLNYYEKQCFKQVAIDFLKNNNLQ